MATQSAEHVPPKETDKRGIPLGMKLYGIVAISFLCFIALSVYQLFQLKDMLETQRSVELKHLTELAIKVVKEEYEASQKGAISAEEAKTRAAARVGDLRYGQNDYFWINDLEPKMVMHPTNPSLNGKNVAGTKDPDGIEIFREFNLAAQKSGRGLR
jgi:methyl-accepting chemotaxis protein